MEEDYPITAPLNPAFPGVQSGIPSRVPGSADFINKVGSIQPAVVSLDGKKLDLYARSTSKIGKIRVAYSSDDGLGGTRARTMDIPNPNSGIDAVTLRDGRTVLVYNTTSGRTPLNLAVGRNGEHFTLFYTLESQPGEYLYPAMIQARNRDLLITYT